MYRVTQYPRHVRFFTPYIAPVRFFVQLAPILFTCSCDILLNRLIIENILTLESVIRLIVRVLFIDRE